MNDALRSINDKIMAAWSSHDTDAFLALLAEDFVWIDDTMPAPMHTLDEARAYTEAWFTAFPDLTTAATNTVIGEDQVATELSFTGTNDGPLAMGGQQLPATGKHVDGRGSYFLKVADGKIVEAHTHPDVAGMMAQIGLMPS